MGGLKIDIFTQLSRDEPMISYDWKHIYAWSQSEILCSEHLVHSPNQLHPRPYVWTGGSLISSVRSSLCYGVPFEACRMQAPFSSLSQTRAKTSPPTIIWRSLPTSQSILVIWKMWFASILLLFSRQARFVDWIVQLGTFGGRVTPWSRKSPHSLGARVSWLKLRGWCHAGR